MEAAMEALSRWAGEETHGKESRSAEADRAEKESRELEIIGPAQAPIYKVNDIYRKILYLKHENYDILIKLKNHMEEQSRQAPWHQQVMIQYDFA